jgi:hypothetical protein
MMTLRCLTVLFLFLCLSSGCDKDEPSQSQPVQPEPIPVQPEPILQECTDGYNFIVDSVLIKNDASSLRFNNGSTQCLDRPIIGSTQYGWHWNWQNQDSIYRNSTKGFPRLIFGREPIDNYSTAINIPRRINNIKAMDVTYDVTMNYSSEQNRNCLLLQSYVLENESGGQFAIKNMIQIWERRTPEWSPFGNRVPFTIPVIDGKSYDLYIGYGASFSLDLTVGWIVYTFVPTSDVALPGRTIHLKSYLDYLVSLPSEMNVNSNHYVSNISFGTQIVEGSGVFKVNTFSVLVQR